MKDLIGIIAALLIGYGILTIPITTQVYDNTAFMGECNTNLIGIKNCEIYFGALIMPQTNHEYLEYTQLMKILNESKVGDTIRIHLNGFGGAVFTGFPIMDAMNSAKGYVVAVLDGNVYSMHAFLFLGAPHREYHTLNATIMVHLGSICQEIKSRIPLTLDSKLLVITALKLAQPILTQDEYNRMFNCEDVYVEASVVKERLGDK